ncbi:MBL fold metallo-hydrolase [Halieaceae bacterium]|nr:MBL fold metallo-hydrolase [Halieaceae bacterium]
MRFSSLLCIAAGTLVILLTGCSRSGPPPEPGADAAGSTAPSGFTVQANRQVAAELNLADQADFEQARRGLIASPQALQIYAADGDLAWSQAAYAFVDDQAPDSVNPSLWRQARLNGIHGLFQVTDGVYQLRGFDLANITLIEGERGWILVDPLTTAATARAAMAFAREHLDERPITAVIFTHSHIDHFGGVDGALRPGDLDGLRVIAPEGFMEEAVSENLLAGTAMQRRATFMYGRNLPVGPRGHVDTGLGKEPARSGLISILEPTDIITRTGQRLEVDGVEMVFQNAGGSEAPAELTFYLPDLQAFCGAEVMSRNMHNLYTLRGAKVRDALAWSGFIQEALDLFGGEAEVYFASHHWPIWGNAAIRDYMAQQRDTYKYLHDQTLRMANRGATPGEIAEQMQLPPSLQTAFSSRGYYGTVKHNARAVYQRYFGWYDGNPARLNPHPPVEAAVRYVDFMGGADAVLARAGDSFDQGDYRWVAEVLNHLVFAEPDNQSARALLAASYDQLGYQAESGPWRDAYLTAAYELRHGKPESGTDLADAAGLIRRVPTALFFESMATNLDGPRAEGEDYIINLEFSDTGEVIVLRIENAVLHSRQGQADPEADAGITLTRALFLDLLSGKAGLRETIFSQELTTSGNRLALVGFFSLFEPMEPVFEIVAP